MSHVERFAPWIAVGAAILWLAVAMSPPAEEAKEPRVGEFGRVPVYDKGRVKPLDTVARVSLMIISGRQTYLDRTGVDDPKNTKKKDDDDEPKGKERPAIQWLLEVMTARARHDSEKRRAFRIQDARVRDLLNLPDRTDGLYAFEEFAPRANALFDEAVAVGKKYGRDKPTGSDAQVFDFAQQVLLYTQYATLETPHRVFRIENDQLLGLLGLKRREGFRYAYDEFVPRIAVLIRERDRAKAVPDKRRSVYDAKVLELASHIELYAGLATKSGESLLVIPPMKPGEDWTSFAQAAQKADNGAAPAAYEPFVKVLRDYASRDVSAFNSDLAEYRKLLEGELPSETSRADFETYFNHCALFYQCAVLYVFMFLLACASWIVWPQSLSRAAFWMGVVVVLVHSLALLARMFLQGRPPVTNLYSSAVFVGWVCVVLGLALEWIFPYGIASAAAALLGFGTAVFAHHLAGSGDTLEMMQAVLDTNFWLSTHVTAVTMGYGATLLAGVLGAIYIVRGLLGTNTTPVIMKSLSTMIYGILCFATLFSFVGTVLGGIWADQSWGRFWGWDPKENGALIIVIWNALGLHARWGGIVKQRGLAVLAVVGLMVTGWSWIGTNQLGVGLHAYGFNNTLATVLVVTWVCCIGLVAAGLTPLRYWRAFGVKSSEPKPSTPPTRRDRRKKRPGLVPG
jgi:ABC-type transport system involved in cytochrome c biogenesis permease subunit